MDEALRIWRSIPGSRQDPEFAAYLNNAGMLHYGQEEYLKAEPYLQEAVTIFRESTPADDPRLAQAMAHLAAILSRLKLHDEADSFSTQSLAGFRHKFDQEPLVGSELLSIRALVLRNANRGREAKRVEAIARDLQRKTGAHHVVDMSLLGTQRRP